MRRPSLLVQTVYFDDEDRVAAAQLGAELYEILMRPADDPLAFGPGIQVLRAVSPACVQLDAADDVVILPVLGKATYGFEDSRKAAIDSITSWHESLGPGHVIPIPTSTNWRREEGVLPGKHLLTEIYADEQNRLQTLDEIVLELVRLLDPDHSKNTLFISHAKSDLLATDHAAQAIFRFIPTYTTGDAFFDVNDLRAGRSIIEQIKDSLSHGVFVSIRTDSYSSRNWCQEELLLAKQNSLPFLIVEVLNKGESLSSPYGGNGPTVLWKGKPQEVVSRAMVECLRAVHFHKEAERTIEAAALPHDTISMCRPPELLDLVQGTVETQRAQTVIYPDPELPTSHRALLETANPKLKLITPTTAFRRFGKTRTTVHNPFDKMKIAMSLSNSPDVDGPEGYAEDHIVDATVFVARCLISTGAHIAYGGDFRSGGYTEILANLIAMYREAVGSDDILHSYLGSPIKLTAAPDDLPITAHHMDRKPLADEALIPRLTGDSSSQVPVALYFSDMRRVMTDHTAARVVIGGESKPRIEEIEQTGYAGRYPGVVEEAWRSLKIQQPLYIAGGYGGAAGMVAQLMDKSSELPEGLQDDKWLSYPSFKQRADAIDQSPYRTQLQLPRSMQDLAHEVRELSLKFLDNDTTSIAWNGLTIEQNYALMRSRDPAMISTLVFNGLHNIYQQQLDGKLEIELVHGSVTAASDVDVLAIGAFDDIPLGGAGAVLDAALAGKATLARAGGQVLVGLESNEIDADWLYFASLGTLGDLGDDEDLVVRIEEAGRRTANQALRHGFSRLGVIAFGGTVISDLQQTATALVRGLESLAGHATIVWFENDDRRYESLHELLTYNKSIKVTTREIETIDRFQKSTQQPIVLNVSLDGELLTSRVLLPSGTAVGGVNSTRLSKVDVEKFSKGDPGRRTPNQGSLNALGNELTTRLFGEHADELLKVYADAKIVVFHDIASSQLPFEILCAVDRDEGLANRPAIVSGINRRLAIPGLNFNQQVAKPPHTGRVKILLVVDPLSDLVGAAEEGKAVKDAIGGNDRIELIELLHEQATVGAFKDAIQEADVLHYCGHAFYDGAGEEESGLSLYGNQLFFSDLKNIELPVRLAFVNACESGRVRTNKAINAHESASFAEYFIRSGIDAYLGTYWRVEDQSAAGYAASIYKSLANGETLDQAVIKGRSLLFNHKKNEWANYIFYGEGRFRLITS